jgi:hypothetical protein
MARAHSFSSLIASENVLVSNPLLRNFFHSFHGVFYILQELLPSLFISDPLTQTSLAKLYEPLACLTSRRVLKESYVVVARELLSHLQISFTKLKDTWTTLGHGENPLFEGIFLFSVCPHNARTSRVKRFPPHEPRLEQTQKV